LTEDNGSAASPRKSPFSSRVVIVIAAVAVIAVGLIIGASFYSRASVSNTTSVGSNSNSSLQVEPAISGYAGADFVSSSGTIYPLTRTTQAGNPPSAPSIPSSAANGTFSFLFSSFKYSQSGVSASYLSCSRADASPSLAPPTATGGTNSTFSGSAGNRTAGAGSGTTNSCSQPVPLKLSINTDARGQYVMSTNPVVLPCGNLNDMNGSLVHTKYLLVTFGINPSALSNQTQPGMPVAAPTSYDYIAYADC